MRTQKVLDPHWDDSVPEAVSEEVMKMQELWEKPNDSYLTLNIWDLEEHVDDDDNPIFPETIKHFKEAGCAKGEDVIILIWW